MCKSKEEWRDIEGYEGLYQVSDWGRIKKLARTIVIPEKIEEGHLNSQGYMIKSLTKDGKTKSYLVHRLVAEAFIPNPENKPQIDHKNTIRTDNNVDNLHWVTPEENSNNPLTKLHHGEWKKQYNRM